MCQHSASPLMHESTASNVWWEMEIVHNFALSSQKLMCSWKGISTVNVARYLEAREIVVSKTQTHLFEEVRWRVEAE